MPAPAPPFKPPFPWFGGKSKVAPEVWRRFGPVRNYVEPFMGSLAMLLLRPGPFVGTETVNDADGFLANFWRAVRLDPAAVAEHADWPVNENDLHARHVWLREQRATLTRRLEGRPGLPRRQDRRLVGVGPVLLDRLGMVRRGPVGPVVRGGDRRRPASSSTWAMPGKGSTASASTWATSGKGSTASSSTWAMPGKGSTASSSTWAMPGKGSTASASTWAMPGKTARRRRARGQPQARRPTTWPATSRPCPTGSDGSGCAAATGRGSAGRPRP